MKYLEDMSDEELLMIAKRERILLNLKFLRGEIINNLETKGYTKKDPVKAEAERLEIEKERNRPKRSEIRIAPDGSVEVIEIPLEDNEIEDINEVQREVIVKTQPVQESIVREVPKVEAPVIEVQETKIIEEVVNPDNLVSNAKIEEIDSGLNDIVVQEQKISPIVIEKKIEEVEILEPEAKIEEVKSEESTTINSENNGGNIRIVILNQEKESNKKKIGIKRKNYRNFISRKSSKTLRVKTHDLYNLRNKLKTYPMSFDEKFIDRRIRESKIQNSKYTKGREEYLLHNEDRFFDRAPLPSNYFVDEIVLMPKNNNTLFTYWEVREDTYNKLKEENNVSSNVIIKVYKDGIEDRRIVRSERLGSHYIHDIEAAKNYDVSIGYEDENGEFIEIAHSSKSLVPRDEVSDIKEPKWLEVDENNDKKEVDSPENSDEDNYIDEDVFSILLDKLRNVRSS